MRNVSFIVQIIYLKEYGMENKSRENTTSSINVKEWSDMTLEEQHENHAYVYRALFMAYIDSYTTIDEAFEDDMNNMTFAEMTLCYSINQFLHENMQFNRDELYDSDYAVYYVSDMSERWGVHTLESHIHTCEFRINNAYDAYKEYAHTVAEKTDDDRYWYLKDTVVPYLTTFLDEIRDKYQITLDYILKSDEEYIKKYKDLSAATFFFEREIENIENERNGSDTAS